MASATEIFFVCRPIEADKPQLKALANSASLETSLRPHVAFLWYCQVRRRGDSSLCLPLLKACIHWKQGLRCNKKHTFGFALYICFSIIVIKHQDPKQFGDEMGLCHLPALMPRCISDGSQGRNLEVRTEIEAVERLSLLTRSAYFLLQPRSTCSGLALPRVSQTLSRQSLSNQMPRRLAYRQSDVDFFSNQVLFSQRTLVCTKLKTKEKQKQNKKINRTLVPLPGVLVASRKTEIKGECFILIHLWPWWLTEELLQNPWNFLSGWYTQSVFCYSY